MFRKNRADFSIDRQPTPKWVKLALLVAILALGGGMWHYHQAQVSLQRGVAPVYSPSDVTPMARLMAGNAAKAIPPADRLPPDTPPALRRAMDGDADAMVETGRWYFDRGTNYKASIKWFKRAALSGHREGCLWLGYHYERGLGRDQSQGAALAWYMLAREIGADFSGRWRARADWIGGTSRETQRDAERLAAAYRDRVHGNARARYGRIPVPAP